MQDYNMPIYFQTAFLSGGGDKFASPYMAFQKPLLVTILENYNAKSIKPNHHSYGKFKNYKLKDTSGKRNGRERFGLKSTLPHKDKPRSRWEVINVTKHNQMKKL